MDFSRFEICPPESGRVELDKVGDYFISHQIKPKGMVPQYQRERERELRFPKVMLPAVGILNEMQDIYILYRTSWTRKEYEYLPLYGCTHYISCYISKLEYE